MPRPLIRLGDTHSHGGQVTSASPHATSDGKAIARLGDKAKCESHGDVTIASGDPHTTFDGKPAARDGDKLSCGAVLIASQSSTDCG